MGPRSRGPESGVAFRIHDADRGAAAREGDRQREKTGQAGGTGAQISFVRAVRGKRRHGMHQIRGAKPAIAPGPRDAAGRDTLCSRT